MTARRPGRGVEALVACRKVAARPDRGEKPRIEAKLVDAYFARPNRDYPLINEVSFRTELEDKSRRANDREWTMLAMSIFAVASRFVDDERVFDLTFEADDPMHTRGAKWYNCFRMMMSGDLIWPSPALSHIQAMLLAVVCKCGHSYWKTT